MNETAGIWALLGLAAYAAGVLNAIAGGGSFLTFPALVFAGISPISANATSAVAVSPGYLGSSLGLRRELALVPWPQLRREMLISALGGWFGAMLLLVTPARVFSGLVPWLLLFATLLFALGPRWVRVGAPAADAPLARWRAPALFAVSVYGGYFNGGLGILLMALYTLAGESRLPVANALKNLNSFLLSLLSVAAFAWAGAIAWPQALWMMAAATLGGYHGARLARWLSPRWVRSVVIVTGTVMSVAFFARSFA
jgi:hypothetical protein